jgi:hypothetical protein
MDQQMSSGKGEWNPSGKSGHYGKLAGIAGAVVIIGGVAWATYSAHGTSQDQPPPAKIASDNATPADNGGAPAGQTASPNADSQSSQPAQSAYTPTAATTDQSQASNQAQGSQPQGSEQQTASAGASAQPGQGSDSAQAQSATASAANQAQPAQDQSVATADTGASNDNSAPAASSKPKHHAAKDKTETASAAPVPQAPPASDALKQWWATGGDAAAFKVKAVGPGADGASVVMVFSQPVDANSAGQHLRLLNEQGAAVSGSWQNGQNPYVLAAQGLAPGRYMLFVDQSIASSNGQALGADVQGPVFVSQRVAQAEGGGSGGQP